VGIEIAIGALLFAERPMHVDGQRLTRCARLSAGRRGRP
jgi:hypothetical protein